MDEKLALHGGTPVRNQPFGPSHDFGDEEIAALTEVVRSGSIGKGSRVAQFERAFAAKHGVDYAENTDCGCEVRLVADNALLLCARSSKRITRG